MGSAFALPRVTAVLRRKTADILMDFILFFCYPIIIVSGCAASAARPERSEICFVVAENFQR